MSYESTGDQGTNVGSQHEHHHHHFGNITGNSALIQAIGGGTAVVLTILGLVGLSPMYMASIATIAVAVALTVQGITVGSCYSHIVNETGGKHPVADIRTGLTAEFVAGSACIILGVLAVLGIQPAVLTSVAAIVLGSGVLLGAGIANRLAHFSSQGTSQHPFYEHMVTDAVTAAAGAEVLVGGGAIVLGVIALAGTFTYTLSLVALLALGASIVITSTALSGKMGGVWAHHH